jgi:hypothetical protein
MLRKRSFSQRDRRLSKRIGYVQNFLLQYSGLEERFESPETTQGIGVLPIGSPNRGPANQ